MQALAQTDIEFLRSLSADRLLYFFRTQAGLSNPSGINHYGGWEDSDLRGHTLGHYLTALSLLYAQTGDTDAKSRIDHIVDVLRAAQQKQGTGYIGAFGDGALTTAENDGSGWAPYYTMHKILQGLIDAYVYGGNETALTAASDMGTYFYNRTLRLTNESQWLRSLDIMEIGGFPEAMLNLYALTHDARHLQAGQFFQQMSKLQPSADGQDILSDSRTANFHHANATIPQFIAAEREYELTGNTTMLAAARNFWDNVTGHRSYCNGSTGYHEHWNLLPDRLSQELNVKAGESCCTNNMIRLSNDLFRLLRQAKYAEYVERATLNHIMSSINPENSNFMYFHTQRPGSYKTYGRNTDVFWCCTGTGMENHVRYGQSVFFSDDDTLYVCQFFPSKGGEEAGLRLRQETNFPNEEHTRLIVEGSSVVATLKVRIPQWTDGFAVRLNGGEVEWTEKDGFCCIRRTWNEGDVLDIDLPMHLYLEPLADSPRTAAIMYGPMVLAGDFGGDDLTYDLINTYDNYFNDSYPSALVKDIGVPVLTGSMEQLDWLKKTDGKMEFTTTATSDGSLVRMIPLYKAFAVRFTDYWKFAGELNPAPLKYPTAKTGAEPVTQLEDGVEYFFQNANATLANRNVYWDWQNLRTRSNGNVDDVRIKALRSEEGAQEYWSFLLTAGGNNGQYLGRTNHANVQSDSQKLWIVNYVESEDEEGSGFTLHLQGDDPDESHAMMMNGDGTWVVVWQGDHGTDYTPKTTHWQFFRTADLDPEAMQAYNAANLLLYQYLREASQMYDRGISSVVAAYNSGIAIYSDPNKTVEQMEQATEIIRQAIAASVSEYEEGVPATYGIINPSFENLSAQGDISNDNGLKSVPFGWTLTKNGNVVTTPDWWWCCINQDGGAYMDGNHIYGVWNGNNYGDIELSQTLSGMPNGLWRLTALVMNNHSESNNQARLFLNNSSMLAGTESDYSGLPAGEDYTFSGEWSNADNDMHQRFLVESNITDGILKFGIRANGFFKADDFQLTFLGDQTGIESIKNSKIKIQNDAIFDLSGRRVFSPLTSCSDKATQASPSSPSVHLSHLKKGIYIVNGKKVVI